MTLWKRLRRAFKKPIPLINEADWSSATKRYRFLDGLTDEELRRLRYIASDFLARKNFMGAAGFEVTDSVMLEIALQACILVLSLDVDYYDGWKDIVIYPSQFRPRREYTDASGVVHTSQAVLAGEAWLSGPVVLSYEDVVQASLGDFDAHNVVIHEFAHKIDMLSGEANGSPPLHKGMDREVWKRTFMEAYLRFCEQVDRANALPIRERHQLLQSIAIDPYAAESPAEFFAVISECFFVTPESVMEVFPQVYGQLRLFYKQDPLARQIEAGAIEVTH